jgi:hypothetical protein
MAPPRRYRYLRARLRHHFYSFWIVFPAVLPLIAGYAWVHRAPGRTDLVWLTVGWAVFSLVMWLGSRWNEARNWRKFEGLSHWFEGGCLHCDGQVKGAIDLGRVRKVDVFMSAGTVDRLAIWLADEPAPLPIVGIDQPEAFASELRRHAPRARFETVNDW